MATPITGQISASDLNTALGKSSTASFSFSCPTFQKLAAIPSSNINVCINNAHAAAYISTTQTNLNLSTTVFSSPSTATTYKVLVDSSVTIGGTSSATPALSIGQFPTGSSVILNNYGIIEGGGGTACGGIGGTAVLSNYANQTVTINNYGTIEGGGGGGGKGGSGGKGDTGGTGGQGVNYYTYNNGTVSGPFTGYTYTHHVGCTTNGPYTGTTYGFNFQYCKSGVGNCTWVNRYGVCCIYQNMQAMWHNTTVYVGADSGGPGTSFNACGGPYMVGPLQAYGYGRGGHVSAFYSIGQFGVTGYYTYYTTTHYDYYSCDPYTYYTPNYTTNTNYYTGGAGGAAGCGGAGGSGGAGAGYNLATPGTGGAGTGGGAGGSGGAGNTNAGSGGKGGTGGTGGHGGAGGAVGANGTTGCTGSIGGTGCTGASGYNGGTTYYSGSAASGKTSGAPGAAGGAAGSYLVKGTSTTTLNNGGTLKGNLT